MKPEMEEEKEGWSWQDKRKGSVKDKDKRQ